MSKKKQKQIAKFLFKRSLTGGFVDEKKIKIILASLSKENSAGIVGILKSYKRLIEAAIAREEVIVEVGSAITNAKSIEKKLLEKTGARRVIFKLNSQIVFGARVKHGDWIWDDTLDAKLEQIILNF
ncbi:MAG: F0F1 ATP synthase subunit delta [Candidatus Curtissbacteria bacterium]|nr:F0F1 ATP synthase subunit delta [Candidatus Curtissbacteria bacterium]